MQQPIDWVDEAVQSLHAAADRADGLGSADLFSTWSAMADQIRLVAYSLDPLSGPGRPRPRPSVGDCLTAALEALDRVGPLTRPSDLPLWEWHVREIRDLVDRLGALP